MMIWLILFSPVSSLFIIWLTIVPPAAELKPFMSELTGLHYKSMPKKEEDIWQGPAVTLASPTSSAVNTGFIKQLMHFKQHLGSCSAQMLLDKNNSVLPPLQYAEFKVSCASI